MERFVQTSPDSALMNADDAYQSGQTLFFSQERQFVGEGLAAHFQMPATQLDAAWLMSALRQSTQIGLARKVLFAILPFDSSDQAWVNIPQLVFDRSFGAIAETPKLTGDVALDSNIQVSDIVSQLSPCEYAQMVQKALWAIDRARFEKVVLARSLNFAATIDIAVLVNQLVAKQRSGYQFAFPCTPNCLQAQTQISTWVGASPELLLAKKGSRVFSNPLAGSIPRVADEAEDRLRAQNLLQSAKDLHEHHLVVKEVERALQPFCRELHVPKTPELLKTPTMWHLSTPIEGVLYDAHLSSLILAQALHPTPAVCGYPTAAAQSFIRAHEGFERELFTGVVGWHDEQGDGEWAVTIRCAKVSAAQVQVYAGAGIVAGSEPDSEVRETRAKMQTILNIMGIAEALAGAR